MQQGGELVSWWKFIVPSPITIYHIFPTFFYSNVTACIHSTHVDDFSLLSLEYFRRKLHLLIFWIMCPFAGKTLVGMGEVEAAIQEMFQAPHMQVSKIVTE